VVVARDGVEETEDMRATPGRSVYFEESVWSLVPNAGAEGIISVLEDLENTLAPAS
jgi:dihydroxyacetone kinase